MTHQPPTHPTCITCGQPVTTIRYRTSQMINLPCGHEQGITWGPCTEPTDGPT